MWWRFLCSVLMGVASYWAIGDLTWYYVMAVMLYGMLMFHVSLEGSQLEVCWAYWAGVVTMIFYDAFSGGPVEKYLIMILLLPFFHLLGKGFEWFFKQHMHAWVYLLFSVAFPICLLFMMTLWSIKQDAILLGFAIGYFTMLFVVQLRLGHIVMKGMLFLVQAVLLVYLYLGWFTPSTGSTVMFLVVFLSVTINHIWRGYEVSSFHSKSF